MSCMVGFGNGASKWAEKFNWPYIGGSSGGDNPAIVVDGANFCFPTVLHFCEIEHVAGKDGCIHLGKLKPG